MIQRASDLKFISSHGVIALPAWPQSGRVPCLDGLRAVSIALVVMQHAAQSIGNRRFSDIVRAGAFGHLGVTCFFVISGFLITLLLLREKQRWETISLKLFYLRRALRIIPAYAMYLLAIFLFTRAIGMHIGSKYWAGSLTYTMCFMDRHSASFLAHLWSLAVEEHFYLLWPLLIWWMRPHKAALVALAYIAATPVIRYCLWKTSSPALDIHFNSISQMSTIAAGCLCGYAAFYHNDWIAATLARSRAGIFTWCMLAALIVSIILGHKSGKFAVLFSDPANALFFGLFCVGSLYSQRSTIARLLNTRVMVVIGILSYSIYLWQEPFTSESRVWACRWPMNIVLTLACALVSYGIVEMPFLKMREKLRPTPPAPRKSDAILESPKPAVALV